jgi:nucleoside diphosphate kinase
MILVNAEGSEGDPIAKWKKMIGAMNPEEAKKANPENLRGKYGKTVIKN